LQKHNFPENYRPRGAAHDVSARRPVRTRPISGGKNCVIRLTARWPGIL
jgi:hypothetical protein